MAAPHPNGSSGRSSIFSSLKHRRSISPNVNRLLELCVLYQQQQQDSQNALPTSSSSVSSHMSTWTQDSTKKIRALVKELLKTKRPNIVDELEHAILHRESQARCIVVPKSFGNSTSPATLVVEFCCLWRWPDLSNGSHLKPVNECQNAFHYQLDQICINPFHYERVPTAYSVCVPHVQPESTRQTSDPFAASAISNTMPKNAIYQRPSDEHSISSPASVSSESTLVSTASDNPDLNENYDGSNMMDIDMDPINATSHNITNQNDPSLGTQVRLEEPREWCRLSYYEMSTRVGEQYRATQPYVIIDGYTNTSDACRFSLGSLGNIHRSVEVERVRRAIGLGVKLYHIYGDVFAECLSQNPVFVQSPIGNRLQGWEPSTVCKIEQNVRFKIFDLNQFTEILSAAIQEGYESVYNLTKICIIRMSLAKGWGADYARPLVSSTPCWIEIYLDGPLKWIDNILLTIHGPHGSATSVS